MKIAFSKRKKKLFITIKGSQKEFDTCLSSRPFISRGQKNLGLSGLCPKSLT